MSKSKKLGRGLEDLLKRQQGEATFADEEKNKDLQSENVDKNSEKNDEKMTNSIQESHNSEVETGIDDEFFKNIHEQVAEAAKEVQGLQVEITNVSAQRNDMAMETSVASSKTLLDYMNSDESESQSEQESDNAKKGETATNDLVDKVVSTDTIVDSVVGNSEDTTDTIYNLSVALIDSNPWQPRCVFNQGEITELAESIKTHGLLQPIVVREFRNRYQLIAGERRLRAALKLNWTQVPATIVDATDREMAELALIENVQRKDLNPIEKATSFEKYLQENHCTQEELARRLNIDRSTISNLIRLLTLPAEIQDKVANEKISQGHARSLLALASLHDQIAMAERIEEEKLSVRQTEQVVSEWNQKPVAERRSGNITDISIAKTPRPKKSKSPHILDIERQLQEALDLKVKISADDKGKGKLEIFFQNQEDFSSLMDYFKG